MNPVHMTARLHFSKRQEGRPQAHEGPVDGAGFIAAALAPVTAPPLAATAPARPPRPPRPRPAGRRTLAWQVGHTTFRSQNTDRHTLHTNATSTGLRWQKHAARTSTDTAAGRTTAARVSMPGKNIPTNSCASKQRAPGAFTHTNASNTGAHARGGGRGAALVSPARSSLTSAQPLAARTTGWTAAWRG